MEAIKTIQIVSVLISLVAPVFFYMILQQGIKKSNFDARLKLKFNGTVFLSTTLWVAVIYFLTVNNAFAYNSEDSFPKFLIGLFVPVVVTLLLLLNNNFKTILDNVSFKYLAAGQLWRVLGAIFFLVAISGIGPREFIGSGIGDVITGLLAIVTVWAITRNLKWSKMAMWSLLVFGVTDLLVVLYILLTNYPIWSDVLPSTAMAGSFPMMLIIGIAAPMALLQHIFMLRKLIIRNKANQFFK